MFTTVGTGVFRHPHITTKSESPISYSAALLSFSVQKFNRLNCQGAINEPPICTWSSRPDIKSDAPSQDFWTLKPEILTLTVDWGGVSAHQRWLQNLSRTYLTCF